MREIIYIQTGNVSNYIGTHFFNTCESYFTYDVDDKVKKMDQIDHNVSFREGVAPGGQPTFCPRLLLFDEKENFGALPKINDLYSPELGDEIAAWGGDIGINKQVPIEKSAYQRYLDEGEDEDSDWFESNDQLLHSVRYWSDFNRVYHIPRTLQPVPFVGTRDTNDPDCVTYWADGVTTFQRECLDNDLMDGDFRRFVEECDLLQGVQTTFDASKFASFTTSMIQLARECLPKTTALSFMVNCVQNSGLVNTHDPTACRAMTNASLAMCALEEYSDVNVPLLHPLVWRTGAWTRNLTYDSQSLYHTTALLSSHLESATLPLRLKSPGAGLDLQALSCQLDTKFAHLTGIFPTPRVDALEKSDSDLSHDFSVEVSPQQITHSSRRSGVFAEWGVLRSTSLPLRDAIEDWIQKTVETRYPFVNMTRSDIEYPLPFSFPRLFNTSSLSADLHRSRHTSSHRSLDTVPIYSALRCSAALSSYFNQHYKFIDTFIRGGTDLRFLNPDGDDGIGKDELREVREAMLKLRDAFSTSDAFENEEAWDEDGRYDIY
ncbi:Misato segment II tubulin-like domain-containing protein [Cantharellus anzutake]|uniref:Misato segment II tubulin-like domain-containing protein n=1 Tax=Cantharellus anzutake TaxID=1750568 RepID=UPI001905E788|nr:Misato segment II tubulin-like domain-containing protein [Cantharellus anzutake]KAF8335795.1 Misato segment II tubulin-like domain-containing protein [Cantharellus anzutake]